ncbi:DUF952 domain-containing protein [Nocardioides sp. HM23]|uniref:DUF952 domain-containing protein n=1 Tax=Nocardioides bizhenqiangii TaxID=3095076 RepID=UPI002ACA1706|nr:DUF952 domain-containing protein [Nocardioides sp. HM23]MDZ5620810.1 DUF952 domain-containing protein [Nocardioides sp. HM23]
MATIFHLALASDWAAAQDAGAYTTSTRGRTLAEEGFIHCSRGDQWPAVRERFYADVAEPLLLLQLDTDRLDVPVVDEPGAPGSTETFPHVYGPIPLDAVVKAMPVPGRGTPLAPLAAPAGSRQARPTSSESFGRTFLTEMLVNMALVVLILVTTAIGLGVGNALGDEVARLVGVAVGVLAGCGIARWLYVSRHA